MQYPIIDLITSAYLNNGWTGLNVSTGKNLLEFASSETYTVNAYYTGYAVDNERLSPFQLVVNQTYTLSFDAFTTSEPFDISIGAGNGGYSRTIAQKLNQMNGRVFVTFTPNETDLSNGNILAIRPIRYNSITNFTSSINNVMLELGSVPTEYEPYGMAFNDFPHRLKLPLILYFPHPVIDALTRASNGTLTDNDKQILRHYLTPLGIGGI